MCGSAPRRRFAVLIATEYGLTPALGLGASVPQAGTCEVGAAGTCHVVPLAALLPGTRYDYRLRTNGTIVQTTNYFTTLPAPVDPGDVFVTVVGAWATRAAARRTSPTCRTPPTRRSS